MGATEPERTAAVELTAMELSMLLRVCHEKREQGAREGDQILYEVPLGVIMSKLAESLADLDQAGGE
jgi:hypothetical protein